MSVPADILRLGAKYSAREPRLIVLVPVDPEYEQSKTAVFAVIVRLVVVAKVTIVAAFPVTVITESPRVSVLTPVPVYEKV
jgi:hypothetical protein